MMAIPAPDPADPLQLIAEARQGVAASLGALMELYRNYLGLLARTQLDARLAKRVSASDVVQETMLDACRDFDRFRGATEGELMAWLRSILVANLARLLDEHVNAQKRSVGREVSLDAHRQDLEQSAVRLEQSLAGAISSPSLQAMRRERAAVLADRLAQLREDDREVIVLRNLEGLSFDEVARRMNRSSGAVRVLWVRAVDRLRKLLQDEDLI